MDATWCYLCRVDAAGGDPQVLWGIALDDDLPSWTAETGPMPPPVAAYLQFLGPEVGLGFDPTFTLGEAARVIPSLLGDPANESQMQTLTWLAEHAGGDVGIDLTYGQARAKIRRLVALRGLRSA